MTVDAIEFSPPTSAATIHVAWSAVQIVISLSKIHDGDWSWTMRKEDEQRLLTMEMSCLRRMFGVTRLDRINK